MVLKLFSPGVRASLSSHQAAVRMMVASAYMLGRPCLTTYLRSEKMSLLLGLRMKLESMGQAHPEKTLLDFFPHQKEYDHLDEFAQGMQKDMVLTEENIVRKSKVAIAVLHSTSGDDYSLMDMVKRKWFGHRTVGVGKEHFNVMWESYKERYTFIKDTFEETIEYTQYNNLQLYTRVLNTLGRGRTVVLTDTSAKHSSLAVASTRIFWPGIKLRRPDESRGDDDLMSLRSNIFSALTFPWPEADAKAAIIQMVRGCAALEADFADIPIKYQRLKVFYEYFNHGSINEHKWDMLEMVKRIKRGVIGFFSRVQTSTDYKYTGYGEWRGVVCDVPTIITMTGVYCTSITLRTLYDIESLSSTLSSLLQEFHLTAPERSTPATTRTYLAIKTNKFVFSESWQSGLIPIILDGNLKMEIFDRITDQAWVFQIKNQSIQIRLRDTLGHSNKEFTMLTDMVNSRDWDPDLPSLYNDPIFSKWQTGDVATEQDLDTMLLNKIPNNSYIAMTAIRTAHSKKIFEGIFMSKIHDAISSLVFPDKTATTDLEKRLEEMTQVDRTGASLEEVEALMAMFGDLDVDDFLDDEQAEWGASIESEQGHLDLEGLTEEEKADMLEFAKAIEESGIMAMERKALLADINRVMPSRNNFFATIRSALPFYLKSSNTREQLANMNAGMRLPGYLGKLMSLYMNLPLESSFDPNEEIVTIGSHDNSSRSNMMEMFRSELHTVADVDSRIHLLNQQARAVPAVADVLGREINNLRRFKIMLTLEGEEETPELDMSDLRAYDKEKITIIIMNHAVGMGKLSNIAEVSENNVEAVGLLHSKMLECLGKKMRLGSILQSESMKFKSAVKSHYMTSAFLDLLSETIENGLVLTIGPQVVYRNLLEDSQTIEVDIAKNKAITTIFPNTDSMDLKFDSVPASVDENPPSVNSDMILSQELAFDGATSSRTNDGRGEDLVVDTAGLGYPIALDSPQSDGLSYVDDFLLPPPVTAMPMRDGPQGHAPWDGGPIVAWPDEAMGESDWS
jgi:hypothetical protein